MQSEGKNTNLEVVELTPEYTLLLEGVAGLVESARRILVRAVNAVLTPTYWEIGPRLVEVEQDEQTWAH